MRLCYANLTDDSLVSPDNLEAGSTWKRNTHSRGRVVGDELIFQPCSVVVKEATLVVCIYELYMGHMSIL